MRFIAALRRLFASHRSATIVYVGDGWSTSPGEQRRRTAESIRRVKSELPD